MMQMARQATRPAVIQAIFFPFLFFFMGIDADCDGASICPSVIEETAVENFAVVSVCCAGIGATVLLVPSVFPQSGQKAEFVCRMLPQEGHRRSCGVWGLVVGAALRFAPHLSQKRCSPMTSAPQLGQVVRIIEAGVVVPCPAVPSATFAPHEGHTAVPSGNLALQNLHFVISFSYSLITDS